MCQFFTSRGLSLPTQVSTTITRPCDSMMKAWIEEMSMPSPVMKCGFSQACCSSFSGVASAKRKLPGVGPSASTTRVMRTSPTCQRRTG